MVFPHDLFSIDGCFEIFCFNLAWWIKSEWGEGVLLVFDIDRNPGAVVLPKSLVVPTYRSPLLHLKTLHQPLFLCIEIINSKPISNKIKCSFIIEYCWLPLLP